MSVAVATETAAVVKRPHEQGSAQRLFKPSEVTLEDVVLGAWEELVADGRVECPVCGASMSMLDGCGECGSDLS